MTMKSRPRNWKVEGARSKMLRPVCGDDKSTNMRCTNNASIVCAASTCVHVLQTAGNASRGLVSFPDPQYGTGLH